MISRSITASEAYPLLVTASGVLQLAPLITRYSAFRLQVGHAALQLGDLLGLPPCGVALGVQHALGSHSAAS